MINPFITTGYDGAKYFCDRVKETGVYQVFDLFLDIWIRERYLRYSLLQADLEVTAWPGRGSRRWRRFR